MNYMDLKGSKQDLLADMQAGFLVFLIALPLCLGIAVASGFPPIAGILTAAVGGCIVSWFGSSRLTIKGPAAGLIVIVVGAVTELGQGDMLAGYHRALAVGVVAALIQMAFAYFRVARFGIAMSKSVVHGMLAAIGVIIIAKQIHVALGVKPEAKQILGLIAEIPHSLTHANPMLAGIGILSLLILIVWPKLKFGITKKLPAQIMVLAVVIPLSLMLDLSHPHPYHFFFHDYNITENSLVKLPGSLLSSIAFPDFSMVFSFVSIKYIIMFALVGMIESTLSVVAVDSLDPKKRTSNLDRDLFALSVGNLVSSLIGGLPMISEIVRSKANVDAGATSAKANFFHGAFLIIFVSCLPGVLGLIPLAALAAMLVFVGARLASPKEFLHVKHVGLDQFFLFMATLVTTLATDLLVGVITGLVLKIILHRLRGSKFSEIFKSSVHVQHKDEGREVHAVIRGAAAFPSLIRLKTALKDAPEHMERVVIDVRQVGLVDHTFLSGMKIVFSERPNVQIVILGLEEFRSASDHPEATRWKKRRHHHRASEANGWSGQNVA